MAFAPGLPQLGLLPFLNAKDTETRSQSARSPGLTDVARSTNGDGGKPNREARANEDKSCPAGPALHSEPSGAGAERGCSAAGGGGGGLSSLPGSALPLPVSFPFHRGQHESLQPRAVRPEEQLLGPQPGHLPEQDPGGRPAEPAVQHERLLLQAQGAGAQHPAEQEGEQDGNPAARHRLHPGPADRPGLAPRHRQPPPPEARAEPGLPDAADHAQHRHQHPVPAGLRIPFRVDVQRQQGALRLSPRLLQVVQDFLLLIFFLHNNTKSAESPSRR